METGRQLAAPATPPRGGEIKHVILSGAGSATARALLARRPRTGAPGSRTESPAPARGCRGRPGRGSRLRLAGCAARGSLAPCCPIGARPGARRAAGGGGARLRAAGRAPQTLVCKAEPRRARRARSGSASSRPGGRWPVPRPPGSSSDSSFSQAKPARARRGPPAPVPAGGPGAARGQALGSLEHRLGAALAEHPLHRLVARSPSDLWPLPGFSSGFIPGCSCRLETPIHTATRKPILATPADLRNPHGEKRKHTSLHIPDVEGKQQICHS